jgi:DNA-binding CsgD family transcriptional regulator/MoxR-like ATPase
VEVEGPEVWPLIGRERELRAIEAALVSGTPGGVVLVGAAGVGKTRLVREALRRWSPADGWLWVAATRAAATIPFGAVSHLLPLEGTGPKLVGIDDAHLLDEASAAVLHQLAVRGLIVPVASVRTGEPVSDAVTALWKENAQRLQVSPLPPPAMDRLLDHALGDPLDSISRERVRELVGGNPLLLRELLLDARDSGALVRRAGVWSWRGPVPHTARLAALTTSWLADLDPPATRVLETIACGEPLALSLLTRLHEAAAVEDVERRGLAVAERSGNRTAIRLAHPLYAEVVRANLPASRARAIFGQLAALLATEPRRRHEDPSTLAVWELESGAIRHPDALLAAARQAIGRFDLGLAERLVRAVRGVTRDGAADRLLARVLYLCGRHEEAAEVLPDEPRSAAILHCGHGRSDEALRVLDPIAGTASGQAARSWVLLLDGRPAAALEAAEAVLVMPESDTGSGLRAATGAAIAAAVLGRPVPAAADPAGSAVDCGRCFALHAAGRLAEAAELADRGYHHAVGLRARQLAGCWAALRGAVARDRGRIADAQVALREALALLDGEDTHGLVRVCAAELAGVHALAGDVAGAREWLVRADGNPHRLFDPWIERNRAWVEAAGSPSRGADTALGAAELARATGQPAVEAACLFDAARLGAATVARPRIGGVAREVGTAFAATLASAVAAWVAGDGPTLERVTATLADGGHLLLAAEMAAVATRVYQRSGHSGQSLALSQRAAALAGLCQGARTPLLGYDGEVRTLSRREHEVAMLAATMPSKQIADQLGLSVHTVNNTLGRAFAKLGVTSRRELAALFAGAGAQR